MSKFYHAESIEQAVAYLKENTGHAVVLAGGTDIMVQVNQYNYPEDTVFVGIENIPETKGIGMKGMTLRIGSTVTASELAVSPLVKHYARALYLAAKESASPQVRNRATVGGNVCTASPSGDMAAALIALEAEAEIVGVDGIRKIRVQEIPVFVKKNCLENSEIIREFIIKCKDKNQNSSFQKIGKRKAMTISIADVAASVTLSEDGNTIVNAKVSAGACAPTIVRLKAFEEALKGCKAVKDAVDEKADKVLSDISPITDMRATEWYRKHLVQVLAVRAVMDAVETIGKGE